MYREKLFKIMSLIIYFVIIEIDKEYTFINNYIQYFIIFMIKIL